LILIEQTTYFLFPYSSFGLGRLRISELFFKDLLNLNNTTLEHDFKSISFVFIYILNLPSCSLIIVIKFFL